MSELKKQRKGRGGSLMIIGGHESKERDGIILNEFVDRLNGGKLIVATVASHEPEGYFRSYEKAFIELDVKEIVELYINERSEALDAKILELFEGATGVFFTGGDQLRIASQIGDTPVEQCVREIYSRGGVIAGTSAGASVMSETMVVKGASAESYRIGDLNMAPGLGFIRDVIIDQHFAERGRIGRLLGAVAQNPRVLGLGIDENTCALVEGDVFKVLGTGAIYAVDGSHVTHSNIAEARPELSLSMHDVCLHVLSTGDAFDLKVRKPIAADNAQTEANDRWSR
jgi:cyanophycinase